MIPRDWERLGAGELQFGKDRAVFYKMESVLEEDGGDDCTGGECTECH